MTNSPADRIASIAHDHALDFSLASRGGVEAHYIPTLTWTDTVVTLGTPQVATSENGMTVTLPANPGYVTALGEDGVWVLAEAMGKAALAAKREVEAARMAAHNEVPARHITTTGRSGRESAGIDA